MLQGKTALKISYAAYIYIYNYVNKNVGKIFRHHIKKNISEAKLAL